MICTVVTVEGQQAVAAVDQRGVSRWALAAEPGLLVDIVAGTTTAAANEDEGNHQVAHLQLAHFGEVGVVCNEDALLVRFWRALATPAEALDQAKCALRAHLHATRALATSIDNLVQQHEVTWLQLVSL